jgi:hypothetical protein
MNVKTILSTWRASRSYGHALKLRRQSQSAAALGIASDTLRHIFDAHVEPGPPLLTWMFALSRLVDELARELGRPEAAEAILSEMVRYWENAISAQPLLSEFSVAQDYVKSFRERLVELNS